MKRKNVAKLRRLGVSDETLTVNARADETGRAVHYICERDANNRLGVKTAIVMTMADTYKLQRSHKLHAKAKLAAANGAKIEIEVV